MTYSTRITLVMAQTAGGIGRHVESLVPELISRGAVVSVAAPWSARRFAGEEAGARYLPVQIPRGLSLLKEARAMAELVGALRGNDLVHAHGIRAGFVTGIAAKAARVRHSVTTIHSGVLEAGWHLKAAARLTDWVTSALTDRTIYVSKTLARAGTGPRMGRETVVIMPAGADFSPVADAESSAARQSLDLASDQKLVVGVGRLHPLKGFEFLIRASAQMENSPAVVIAGDGPSRHDLQELIRQRNVADRVRLLGERDDARALIGAADVFCLPSLTEGSSLALQEALAAGVPIVTTSAEGILETLGSIDSAMVVPPGDAEALAAAIDRVLSDDELQRGLRDSAKRRSADLLDSKTVARRVADLYEELLGRPLGAVTRSTKDTG